MAVDDMVTSTVTTYPTQTSMTFITAFSRLLKGLKRPVWMRPHLRDVRLSEPRQDAFMQ